MFVVAPNQRHMISGGRSGSCHYPEEDTSQAEFQITAGWTDLALMTDPWKDSTPDFNTGYHSVAVRGNRQSVTIEGQVYDLQKGRILVIDAQRKVTQIDWVPDFDSHLSLDDQMMHLLLSRSLIPK